jgi:hypothetical protein
VVPGNQSGLVIVSPKIVILLVVAEIEDVVVPIVQFAEDPL